MTSVLTSITNLISEGETENVAILNIENEIKITTNINIENKFILYNKHHETRTSLRIIIKRTKI